MDIQRLTTEKANLQNTSTVFVLLAIPKCSSCWTEVTKTSVLKKI